MPNQVETKKFIKFLESLGLRCIRVRSSHQVFAKDGLSRPCIVDSQFKNIPINHIKTNLKTLNISYKDFLEKIKNF
jgi:predicted RNA binding protein YcfA (HicA-like mRNA interferase family)